MCKKEEETEYKNTVSSFFVEIFLVLYYALCVQKIQNRNEATEMIKTCIFDLDGTLTDTLESITYSVNLTLKEMKLPDRKSVV